MTSRPNLLLITTDQQRWDSLSRYGGPGYRTPVLDRLAQEGVCFERSYCPTPVCTPARVSILTGLYPPRHGAYTIGVPPVPALEQPTIAHHLAGAGYRTAIVGKTHFCARAIEHQHVAGEAHPNPDDPEPPEAFWDDFDGPYLGFEFVRHCQSHTSDRIPNGHYRSWLTRRGKNLDHLHQRQEHGEKVGPKLGAWELDPEDSQNAWIVEESLGWIGDRQQDDEPWFCWASFQDPHPPFVCPEPYYSQVDMSGVDLGGLRPGEMDDKPPFYKNFVEGRYWTEGETHFWDGINVPAHGLWSKQRDPAQAIRAYIGMCAMIDDYVGRLLAGLERLGARENTLIVFTSDHGEMLGRHGLGGKGPAAYDDCQRVPGLAQWPGGQRGPVGSSASHFNLVDILPTFLDAAGVDIPQGVQGISQLPVIRGESDCVRDWALVDYLATTNLHQQSFIHREHKLVVYRHAAYGELYDLTADPDQYRNLWDAPEAQTIKHELMQRLLRAQMECSGAQLARIASA